MITDILGVTIYVDDFEQAYDFYAHTLGLEKASDAGPNACFFRIAGNDNAAYLEGGHPVSERAANTSSLSFMLVVEDAMTEFDRLKQAGVRMVHDKPQSIGEGNYWFRFCDPAGNILEIVSTATR